MKILDGVIRWSIAQRAFVLIVAFAVSAYGAYAFVRMPIDVFPDLTAPTVTVVTEAHGLAPEEVESLITTPIEAAMLSGMVCRRCSRSR
jgi:Cu/Ag efflux pump CusA